MDDRDFFKVLQKQVAVQAVSLTLGVTEATPASRSARSVILARCLVVNRTPISSQVIKREDREFGSQKILTLMILAYLSSFRFHHVLSWAPFKGVSIFSISFFYEEQRISLIVLAGSAFYNRVNKGALMCTSGVSIPSRQLCIHSTLNTRLHTPFPEGHALMDWSTLPE
jgi:hypothetical protein